MKKAVRGFSLIELLIAVAIIAILTAIGIAVFGSLAGNARDARRKADIDAMAKAYESNYDWKTGKYVTLEDTHFTSKKKPTPPEGGTNAYYNNFADGGKSFTVCAKLEGHPANTACEATSATCYCQSSSLGSTVAVAPGAGGGGGSGGICSTVPDLVSSSGITTCRGGGVLGIFSTVYVDCPSSGSGIEAFLKDCSKTSGTCETIQLSIYGVASDGNKILNRDEYLGKANCAEMTVKTVKLHTRTSP